MPFHPPRERKYFTAETRARVLAEAVRPASGLCTWLHRKSGAPSPSSSSSHSAQSPSRTCTYGAESFANSSSSCSTGSTVGFCMSDTKDWVRAQSGYAMALEQDDDKTGSALAPPTQGDMYSPHIQTYPTGDVRTTPPPPGSSGKQMARKPTGRRAPRKYLKDTPAAKSQASASAKAASTASRGTASASASAVASTSSSNANAASRPAAKPRTPRTLPSKSKSTVLKPLNGTPGAVVRRAPPSRAKASACVSSSSSTKTTTKTTVTTTTTTTTTATTTASSSSSASSSAGVKRRGTATAAAAAGHSSVKRSRAG